MKTLLDYMLEGAAETGEHRHGYMADLLGEVHTCAMGAARWAWVREQLGRTPTLSEVCAPLSTRIYDEEAVNWFHEQEEALWESQFDGMSLPEINDEYGRDEAIRRYKEYLDEVAS